MKTSPSSCTENRAKQHAWQTSCFHVCDHIKNLCTGILTAKLKFKLLVDVHIIMATKPEFLPNFWSLKMKCYGSQFWCLLKYYMYTCVKPAVFSVKGKGQIGPFVVFLGAFPDCNDSHYGTLWQKHCYWGSGLPMPCIPCHFNQDSTEFETKK